MGKIQKEAQKKYNETRHLFLLTFFNQTEDHYEELSINGYHLVKQWNGTMQRWEMAIYSPQSWDKKLKFIKAPVGKVSDKADKLLF